MEAAGSSHAERLNAPASGRTPPTRPAWRTAAPSRPRPRPGGRRPRLRPAPVSAPRSSSGAPGGERSGASVGCCPWPQRLLLGSPHAAGPRRAGGLRRGLYRSVRTRAQVTSVEGLGCQRGRWLTPYAGPTVGAMVSRGTTPMRAGPRRPPGRSCAAARCTSSPPRSLRPTAGCRWSRRTACLRWPPSHERRWPRDRCPVNPAQERLPGARMMRLGGIRLPRPGGGSRVRPPGRCPEGESVG